MFKNLENYLEEISHFLSGREEREEILSEIRSHIMEKAEQEAGAASEASLARVIAAYGKPRQVAEKYLDDRPIIGVQRARTHEPAPLGHVRHKHPENHLGRREPDFRQRGGH